MRKKQLIGSAVAILFVAVTIQAADVPLGHKDFYPSPDRPVGWRGDGNGAFPGATPVTQWREGDVIMENKEIALWGDAGGNQRGTFAKKSVPVFKNQNAVNIVWKTEMPGFSHSQPIVVGDRVFTTADPNLLVCVDVASGKILWQQALDIFELLGQPPEEAEKNRRMLDLSKAVSAVIYNIVNNYTRINPNVMVQNLQRWRDNLVELRTPLADALPIDSRGGIKKTLEALDLAVAEMNALLARKEWDGSSRAEAAKALLPRVVAVRGGGGESGNQQISSWMQKEYDLYPTGHWTGWVGWTWPTPVSDGRYVFVTFGQRQAACFDLNGQRIWARMVPLPKGGKDQRSKSIDSRCLAHMVSPLLSGKILAMQSHIGTLVGLDRTTGQTVWERPEMRGRATHKVLRLADGTDVIVRDNGAVVGVKDGQVLVAPPKMNIDQNDPASIAGVGDVFYFPNAYSHGTCYLEAYRIDLKGTDVTLTKLWQYPKEGTPGRMGSGNTPILTDRFLVHPKGFVFDREVGDVKDVKDRGANVLQGSISPILAGSHVIMGGEAARQTGPEMVDRSGNLMCPYWVLSLEPNGKLTKVSEGNYLGGANLPRMPVLEKYVPKAYAQGLWGRDGESVPENFGYASPFAQGNRIFIRSCSHMYCIGDPKVPYDWNPASRSKEVTESLATRVK